jgi:hypothetical protein
MNLEPILLPDDGMRTIKAGVINGHYGFVVQENTNHVAEIRRRRDIADRNFQRWS